MRFYRAEPTARTSWRLAVLMGANTRTYKFALAQSLLNAAREGREALTIRERAEPYAMELARRTQKYPQVSSAQKLSESDFLSIASQEAAETLADGQPTEKLLDAAEASIPGMVMQKFHNLRETGPDGGLAHRFYEIRGTGRSQEIELTPALQEVAADTDGLEHELDARWSIVETSFDSQIGRFLIDGGVVLSSDGQTLLSPSRRVPVTAARYALEGFQHGRCLVLPSAPFPRRQRSSRRSRLPVSADEKWLLEWP